MSASKRAKRNSTPAGFEPTRRNSSRFRVYRLNRSATLSSRQLAETQACAIGIKKNTSDQSRVTTLSPHQTPHRAALSPRNRPRIIVRGANNQPKAGQVVLRRPSARVHQKHVQHPGSSVVTYRTSRTRQETDLRCDKFPTSARITATRGL